MKKIMMMALAVLAGQTFAQAPIDITRVSNKKYTVQVNVGNAAFAKCLQRNLTLSGLFDVGSSGSIKVTGGSGAVVAEGSGKRVSSSAAFADDKSARMAARKFSDAMVASFSNGEQKGFACDKVLFLKRGSQPSKNAAKAGEICTCYPDGWDIRQHTHNGKMSVYPRWQRGGQSILYISDRGGAPQIWEMDIGSEQPRRKWSFKGTPAGIAVSPDGSKVAAILSFQGNPELYVLEGERYTRLTNTPLASEGQPTWSPDGKKIAYVSNETKNPQIFVIDVATKQKRRLTSRGKQNVDPDWGQDGRIVYVTKGAGSQLAVMNPAEGDKTAEILKCSGSWEHPSWSRDRRHVTATSGNKLYVVDTLPDGDDPRQIFSASGNWISPCWVK